MTATQIESAVEQNGFAIVNDVLSESQVSALIEVSERANTSVHARSREAVYAVRNLLNVSAEIRALSRSEPIRSLARAVLGERCFAVRAVLFDKVAGANWKVPWHQDLTIEVVKRSEVPGFGPWSVKAGVVSVQPPAWVLQAMVSVRVHLDNCDETNGALRVLAGSHQYGRIAEVELPAMQSRPETTCTVPAGGALIMRPLLLHASSPALSPNHRRVIHLDFAAVELPEPLKWASWDAFLESSPIAPKDYMDVVEKLPLQERTI